MSSLGTNVGGIFYSVSLDTAEMIRGQREAQRTLNATSGSVEKFGAKLNQVAGAVKLYAAALALVKVANMADEVRMLSARVNVASGSMERGAEAMKSLQRIAQRTQTDLAGNVQVFGRLNQSVIQMGGTQQDTLQITELLAKAIKVSGASAQESTAAMLQFGQALGSGRLQGDEFRSMMENAPYLMQQLAAGIGVPTGKLREMSAEGKLTSDVIVQALQKAADKIDADFAKMPQTLDAAFTAAADGAGRLVEKLDSGSGVFAALTGIVKGLGDALDMLAGGFGDADTEAGKLARNDQIKTWADGATTVISYVADAAEMVVRGFKQMGTGLGGLAAAAATAARGEGRQAADILKQTWADINAIGNAPYAGAKVRLQQAALAGGTDGSDRMDRLARGGGSGSKLKSTAGPAAGKGKFDAQAYLAGLQKDAVDAMQKIDIVEREALRKNQELLAQGKISRKQAADAAVFIEEAAAKERAALREREAEDIQRRTDAELDAIERVDNAEKSRKADLTSIANPLDALRQQYEERLALVRDYEQMMADAGVDATEQGLMARQELEAAYEQQRLAMAEQTFAAQSQANAFLMNSVNALGAASTNAIMGLLTKTMTARDAMIMLGRAILQEAVGALVQMGIQSIKQAMLEKTLAAAKGAAYAASVSAQVTGMSALAAQNAFAATAAIPMVGPFLAPAAAAAAGAAAAALGAPAVATAPVAGARRYGGPTSGGKLYRINEAGAPEMYTARDGRQYMLPTQDGRVTPADKVGGGSSSAAMRSMLESEPAPAPISIHARSMDDMLTVRQVTDMLKKAKRDFLLTRKDAR